MDVNIDWYRAWFVWSEKKAQALAKAGDFAKLAAFSADISNILRQEVGLWTSLKNSVKGGIFGIAMGLGKWASNNPDPLKDMRVAMRAMRDKYGA